MSRIRKVTRSCFVCGTKSMQILLLSTNSHGAPDLDLRPPGMARRTMRYWVEECPHCGYVNGAVREKTGVTEEWLKREEYVGCSGIPFQSELAKRFYKHYLISKADGEKEEAFYAALCAAWASDDERDKEGAVLCRRAAIEEVELLLRGNPYNIDWKIQRVDMMRRAGMFEEAVKECATLDMEDETLQKIVALECDRAKAEDARCYTLADALREEFEEYRKFF